jgi:integrase
MSRKATVRGVTVWVGDFYDRRGARHRKSGFKTRKEAERWEENERANVVERQALGVEKAKKLTIGDMLDEWLESAKLGHGERPPIERGTAQDYSVSINKHIKPKIGRSLLLDFGVNEAVDFRRTLLRSVSRDKARRVLLHMRVAFNYAIENGYVSLNPVQRVRVGGSARDKKVVQPPSREDVQKLLKEAIHQASADPKKTRFATMLLLLVSTGLRISEARALTWDDFDLENATLNVRRSSDDFGRFERVKSRAARRAVALDSQVISWLKKWKSLCTSSEQNLAFPNGNGRMDTRQNLAHLHLNPLCVKVGLVDKNDKPLYSFHDFRHFRVSELLASGANVREVMEEIGHASSALTLDVYGHLIPENDDRRKERAEKITKSLGNF